jgi:serine beta-lactamase-like protein LACTB
MKAAGGTLALLAFLGFALASASAAPLSPVEAAAVDRAVEAEMARQEAVGLAVGVIEHGEVVYLHGYGWADREKREPVTTETLFRWASISKTLTAVAALQLAEQKKLDLDADVRTYLPEFPARDTPVTARELLCHQSGLPHYENGTVLPVTRSPALDPSRDVVAAVDLFGASPLLFTPGAKFSYTTYGYILLSAVVQRAGKKPFADQVEERIAQPLGLTTLQPDYGWKPLAGRAVGYVRKAGEIVPSTDTDVSWKLGGGGFISGIGDLARWAAALVDRRLLGPATYAAMWTPQKTRDGKETYWGLGFLVESWDPRQKIVHEGTQEKVRSRLVIYPEERHGIVVVSNSEYVEPAWISTVIYDALQAVRAEKTAP